MEMCKYNNLKSTDVDMIPKTAEITGDYFCTWWSQSGAAAGQGFDGGIDGWRAALNQDALFFGEKNYFHPAEEEMRSGTIFLLDDGWDVPVGDFSDEERRTMFGAVDPDREKFSRFGKTPAERLFGMSEKVKEMGYAGLGLWISPQISSLSGEDGGDPAAYWEKRAEWCRDAGVIYWKIDWGAHDGDDEYRKLITDCVHRIAPEIMVENAVVQKPCTHHHGENFLSERAARAEKQMSFSDAYRTYDVLEPFDKVCTLQRAHEALLVKCGQEHSGKGLINGENLYTIAAALGLTVGIMNYNKDAKACLNWHRIAPPFSALDSGYSYSDEVLWDTLYFDTEICSWAPCKGRTVREGAPAVMARNCPLPEVCARGENAPFVIASKHPETSAYAVATVRRTVDPVPNAYYLADVTVKDADINAPVGVFGVFGSLTVEFNEPMGENLRVLAQDLTGGRAVDVTEFAEIGETFVILDGKLMRTVGKSERGHSDWSEPSLIIKIVKAD